MERLGEYRLVECIGGGSTAVVHCAVDGRGRTVALKELRPEFAADPDARRRLAREMVAQGKVHSAYVACLIDGEIRGERPYAVTQYAPGTTLRDLVGSCGPLRGAPLLRFALQFAEGTAAIHEAGVVHRDLAPDNVMMLGGSPLIIDFGIAHNVGAAQVTRPGILIGTPAYLAPELIEGEPVGPAADVFSWGATLAYAASGRAPFGSGSLHSVCFRILRGEADLDGISEPLASLLRLALRRDPASRPPAAWFAGSLRPWCGDPAPVVAR
jgi:serine/threonine protein kinase